MDEINCLKKDIQCCMDDDCNLCSFNSYIDCENALRKAMLKKLDELATAHIQLLKLESEKSWAEEIATSDNYRGFW